MTDSDRPDLTATMAPPPENSLDADDRLKPAFVRAVRDAVWAGDADAARELVRPLHPADIADLIELTPEDDRADLAIALGDLLDADVLAELNDYEIGRAHV